MLRYLMAALAASVLPLAAACGGDGKDDSTPSSAVSSPAAVATNTPNGLEQPKSKDEPLPTPTKTAPEETALQVVNGTHTFTPKASAFRALPTVEVQADGRAFRGVTLAALAEKVGANPAQFVSIQGIQMDGKRLGIIRYLLSDIGSTTVLVIDEAGHVNLASSSIEKDLWVNAVVSVSFR